MGSRVSFINPRHPTRSPSWILTRVISSYTVPYGFLYGSPYRNICSTLPHIGIPCRGFAPGPHRDCSPDPRPAHHPHASNNKSLKPPISMSSLRKIVYAPRGESDHATLRKVRSTWPKVIATESDLAR